jgi:hypothetical protein
MAKEQEREKMQFPPGKAGGNGEAVLGETGQRASRSVIDG